MSATEKEIKIYGAEELKMRIRGRFPAPAWVVLDELREATAWVGSREADAVAFGTWPSRGFQIIGFEVKSHRQDWLNELKHPEKGEAIAAYCHNWYIVCSKDVAKLEEMPPNWGWLVPRGPGLHLEKPAANMQPQQLDHAFLASIIHPFCEQGGFGRDPETCHFKNAPIAKEVTEGRLFVDYNTHQQLTVYVVPKKEQEPKQ